MASQVWIQTVCRVVCVADGELLREQLLQSTEAEVWRGSECGAGGDHGGGERNTRVCG